MSRCWAILTGVYPPAPGGVGDYTRVVARALAQAGDAVHVFTSTAAAIDDAPVRVQGLAAGYTLGGLGALDDAIDRLPPHRQILVQYTPYAFSSRGMNLALPLWLKSRREPVTVMFHEVMHPIGRGQPLCHNLLGRGHRLAAKWLGRRATRLLVSTPRWGDLLRDDCGATCPIDWAPVPSNLPTSVDRHRAARTRARFVRGDQSLIGHFGSYGPLVAALLEPLAVGVLRLDLGCRMLLLGRGSDAFRTRVIAQHPAAAERLIAAGPLEAATAAAHLAACDLVVQPYPDGVTTRRSSTMASLALGTTVVTNAGELTEPIWGQTDAVALAPEHSTQAMISSVATALEDAPRRRVLAQRGKMLYQDRFDVVHTVRLLRGGVIA